MTKSYRHLTYEQRCQIDALKKRGDSNINIARILGVNRSTIIRELKRNSGVRDYHYEQAHQKTQARRKQSACLKMTSEMILSIEEKLRLNWSPEQVSGWLKRHGKEYVSYETIYKHIWSEKKRGGTLFRYLRHSGKKYNKRSKGTAGRGCIPGRVDIKERPKIAEQKIRLGDWELDTIVGARHQGAIVSAVEKTTKLTKLKKVSHKTAEKVEEALTEKLEPIREFVYTLTADNGKEFAYHQNVSAALQADFFFATPYHSWERGLNEHTNGLVRQYFPKSSSFDHISDEDIERVEALLNNRPRKILGFETPFEAFQRMTAMSS
jgi:IS30 family transposase